MSVKRQKRRVKSLELREETMNVGIMTGKAGELVDMMWKVDQLWSELEEVLQSIS